MYTDRGVTLQALDRLPKRHLTSRRRVRSKPMSRRRIDLSAWKWATVAGMVAAGIVSILSAYRSRDAYWLWLMPASLGVALVVTPALLLPPLRGAVHDVQAVCRLLIGVGLAVVGILAGGAPIASVRLLLALIGPAMLLYTVQFIMRADAEAAVLNRELDRLKTERTSLEATHTILQTLLAMAEVQNEQVKAQAAVWEALLDARPKPQRQWTSRLRRFL